MNLVQQYDQEHKARQQRFAEAAAKVNPSADPSATKRMRQRIWDASNSSLAKTWCWWPKIAEESSPDKNTLIREIYRFVSDYYGVDLAGLQSNSRVWGLRPAKHAAAYLAHKLTGVTFSEIGRQMGHVDHSMCLHNFKKAKERIANDPAYAEEMRQLEERLRQRQGT